MIRPQAARARLVQVLSGALRNFASSTLPEAGTTGTVSLPGLAIIEIQNSTVSE
jgi:hypothetical protein